MVQRKGFIHCSSCANALYPTQVILEFSDINIT